MQGKERGFAPEGGMGDETWPKGTQCPAAHRLKPSHLLCYSDDGRRIPPPAGSAHLAPLSEDSPVSSPLALEPPCACALWALLQGCGCCSRRKTSYQGPDSRVGDLRPPFLGVPRNTPFLSVGARGAKLPGRYFGLHIQEQTGKGLQGKGRKRSTQPTASEESLSPG